MFSDIGIGDAGSRRGAGEDDLADERADHLRPDPAADQARLADEEVEARCLVSRVDERRPSSG